MAAAAPDKEDSKTKPAFLKSASSAASAALIGRLGCGGGREEEEEEEEDAIRVTDPDDVRVAADVDDGGAGGRGKEVARFCCTPSFAFKSS